MRKSNCSFFHQRMLCLEQDYFLSFFSSVFVVGFSSVLLSGLIMPFTVSPIGNLSNTPRLGATVFTNVFRKLLVPPFPPSNTVIFPKFMCSNAFTCSPAISFHWSTILYWIAIAGFDLQPLPSLRNLPLQRAMSVSYLLLRLPVSFG